MTKKKIYLRRCPFCGGPADIVLNETKKPGKKTRFVMCKCVLCGSAGKTYSYTAGADQAEKEEAAARAWNARSISAAELSQALQDLIESGEADGLEDTSFQIEE